MDMSAETLDTQLRESLITLAFLHGTPFANRDVMKSSMTQVQCDEANALRAYEAAHEVWMNTSVFTEQGQTAKANLAVAREAYVNATKAVHPDWIVL